MSDRSLAVELRRSASVLRTEWWLLVGGIAGVLLYGAWVLVTGLLLESVVPAAGATVLTSVATTSVTVRVAVAAVVWLLVPAAVVTWLLNRQLSNTYGNLVSQYRFDHPGVLPAPTGVIVALTTVAAVAVGPRTPVLVVMAVAGVHLLVRTVAFGRRVYSFSPRPLFSVLVGTSAVALAAACLAGAPAVPGTVGARMAAAGVPAVVETGLAITGLARGTALGVLVAVPALLSGLYLGVQAVVARRVRAKAPLANPQKRAEQRYPIMPPVTDSSRPGPPTSTADRSGTTRPTDSTAPPDGSDATTGATDDDSHTRVFTADEPVPEEGEAVATVTDDGEGATDDGWIDDTAIFSLDGAGGAADECDSCGQAVSEESVTFCPNCGSRL